MHEVEREIVKASGYKVQRKFSDRQDYLKSLLNSVAKMNDDGFEALSDEAAAWANAAVEANNSRSEDIPDFDEVAPAEAAAEEATDDAEGGEAAEDELAEEVSDPEEGTEETAHDEDGVVIEDEPEEKPKQKAAPAKPPAKPVVKKAAAKPKVQNKDDDVVLDKWGAMEGSMNSRALAMFEKGASMKEVKEELGGTYYNILKRAVEQGHTMEKVGHLITLTHKDAGKKAAAKTPPKKRK